MAEQTGVEDAAPWIYRLLSTAVVAGDRIGRSSAGPRHQWFQVEQAPQGRQVCKDLAVDRQFRSAHGQALATVAGMRDGVPTRVYTWSLNVYDVRGGDTTSFGLPSYQVTERGSIHWTATVFHADPDADPATAITTVK